MNTDATGRRAVWFRIPVGNFLFIYAGQSVGVVVVFVRVKLAQESNDMVVEFLVPGFPSEREHDMLVDKRCVRDNPGFFVFALVKRYGQRPDLFFHVLFELGTAVVRFNPRFLNAIVVYQLSFQIWFSDL